MFNSHEDLPFSPEKKKVEKIVCSIKGKEKLTVHVRALNKALNHRFILKKANRVIQYNQRSCLKKIY